MMQEMKDSGIKWIGKIPADWVVKPLKYVSSNNEAVLSEATPSDYSFRYVDIGAVSADKGIGEYKDITFGIAPSRARKKVCQGDTIISTVRTYLKAIAFVDDAQDVIVSTGFSVRSPFPFMYPKFLYYFCISDGFIDEVNKFSTGVTYPAIGDYPLGKISVTIPPLAEQQAIAAFLDDKCAKLDSIIADLERQIEILQEYKKSVITHAVTKGLNPSAPMKDSGVDWIGEIPEHWDTKRLKYLGTAQNGLTYEPDDITFEDGTLVLRSSNIQNGKLDLEDTIYVSCKIPSAIILKKDDILLCSRNGSRHLIGKCIRIDEQTAGETYGAFMCVFRSDHNQFLHYTFQSEIFNYYLATFLTSTVNQLTNANLLSMVVPITFDKIEQEKIVNHLSDFCCKVDNLITKKEKSLAVMRENKSSLIYEYVTGKKRIKEAATHAD